MCTFHRSAEQKIISDGAPSSRDFPAAATGGGGDGCVHLKMEMGKREGAMENQRSGCR